MPTAPEFPFPLPPDRRAPERTEPATVPIVPFGPAVGDANDGRQLVHDRLIEQRRILVSGSLDREAVTSLSAQLMALDGSSGDDAELVLNSTGGPLSEIFAVLDVIELMRARVDVTCIGSVTGTATSLVAVGSGERRAAPHATFSLRIDEKQSFDGTADDLIRHADELRALRARYLAVLAGAIGRSEEILAEELDRGRRLNANEALEFGIIDTITGTDPR